MRWLLAFLLCLPAQAQFVPKDKQAHFLTGFAVGAGVSIGFRWSGGGRLQSTKIGFLFGTAEGIRKEYYDHAYGGRADFQDAAMTMLGAYCGSLTVHFLWPEPKPIEIKVGR